MLSAQRTNLLWNSMNRYACAMKRDYSMPQPAPARATAARAFFNLQRRADNQCAFRRQLIKIAQRLQAEFAPHNITVNNVMPGFTRTDRLKKLIGGSARARYVSGVSISVDGGWIKGLL